MSDSSEMQEFNEEMYQAFCADAEEAAKQPYTEAERATLRESLAVVFGHCGGSIVAGKPQVHSEKEKFEYAEHRWLGDHMKLRYDHDDLKCSHNGMAGEAHLIKLDNGLRLTYGEINGLAGDFFGTAEAISKGSNLADQMSLFRRAFDTLAVVEDGRNRVERLRDVLRAEVAAVNQAEEDGSIGTASTSPYTKLADETFKLEDITMETPGSGPTYLQLAQINQDHFGLDAHRAYIAGHTLALKEAQLGSCDNLQRAYAINAFADHFLQDSFSAGHMRTPRPRLADSMQKNFCAKLMHDEDNRLGLKVENASKDVWYAYGDKHLLTDANDTNFKICHKACEASISEVYEAFRAGPDRDVLKPEQFGACKLWPDLHELNAKDVDTINPAPLFRLHKGKVMVRSPIDGDRGALSSVSAWNSYSEANTFSFTKVGLIKGGPEAKKYALLWAKNKMKWLPSL